MVILYYPEESIKEIDIKEGSFVDEKAVLMPESPQVNFARRLRRQQTDAERKLWSRLRNQHLDREKFRRQEPLGNYIVDFVSFEQKLVVEIDGGQHNEEQTVLKDENRTKWLESQGFRVLRFWDNDVLTNMDGVLSAIQEALK